MSKIIRCPGGNVHFESKFGAWAALLNIQVKSCAETLAARSSQFLIKYSDFCQVEACSAWFDILFAATLCKQKCCSLKIGRRHADGECHQLCADVLLLFVIRSLERLAERLLAAHESRCMGGVAKLGSVWEHLLGLPLSKACSRSDFDLSHILR